MTRVALVTGAAGGIGQATVHAFAAAGWAVVGSDRHAHCPLQNGHYIPADLRDAAQVGAIAAQVRQTFGRLDALVNNAALQVCKSALDTTLTEWDEIMAVNVRAAFLLAQDLYPLLQATQGSIVNVSSVHAVATSANIAAYAASKGALVALTRALAIEFAAAGIRVNALLPGAIDTAMLRSGLERGHLTSQAVGDRLQELGRKTVMGRVGQAEEIAQAILFLADPAQSGFMTGQSLIVDGGATIRLSTE